MRERESESERESERERGKLHENLIVHKGKKMRVALYLLFL